MLFVLAAASCGDEAQHGGLGDIELLPGPVLRGAGDTLDLAAHRPAIARNGYIVSARLLPPSGGLVLFDSVGRIVRTFGRAGRGPGEFSRLDAFGFGPGDTLWAFDGAFAAHAFAPPPSLEYSRTVRFAEPCMGEPTAFGFLCAAAITPVRVMPPRLMDWHGAERRRFGSTRPPRSENELGPVLLVDSLRLWRGRSYEYVLELLTPSGIERRVERSLAWFPPDSMQPGAPWILRPPPRIRDLSLAAENGLAVLILRAHRDWRPQSGTAPVGPIALRTASAIDISAVFEGVLEVVSVQSGAAVASREVDGSIRGFAGAGRLYSIEESETGEVTIRLWILAARF